ncbi:hypothetical protein CU098_010264, partial [Rhizopus stolonifer]
ESNTTFPENSIQERLKETNGDVVGVKIPYKMDTKYYSAKVDFWLDEIEQEQETIPKYIENKQVSQVIDAFVFVFDKAEHFESIKLWLPFLDKTEPNIRMCINQSHQNTEDMNDWCLSNGFDYVDMNEKTETPMDKVGIALALEILQTNLWDGMIRKDKGGMTEREEELELIREIQELQLHREDKEEEEEDDIDLPSPSQVNEMRQKLFSSLEEDDDLDKTFQMIEHGKTLSDEERRKMAAQVALSFAAQLGI